MGVGWVALGAGVSEFFYYESKFRIRKNVLLFFFCFFFFGGGGGGGGVGGQRGVSEFLQRIKIKKKNIFLGGRGRWTDGQSGPNQFAPSPSSKLGP